jgi:hypothetical protein
MTVDLLTTRRTAACALALLIVVAGAALAGAQPQPASFFTRANVQTHTVKNGSVAMFQGGLDLSRSTHATVIA